MNPVETRDSVVEEITIHAPAERVFEAFSNPRERVKWWGREGRFHATDAASDLRPGGRWSVRGIGMGGRPFVVSGEYREIRRPSLLVFTWLPDWQSEPLETLVRVDFEEQNDVTRVRLTHSGLTTDNARESHRGWPQILEWLQAYVEKGAPLKVS